MKELLKFKTISTFAYLLPFALAVHYQLWITIIPLGLLILVCLEYHTWREKKFRELDHVFAWAVIASNVVLCYQGGFAMPSFALTIGSVVLSVIIYTHYTKKIQYNRMHGIWHITSAFITVFSILTYVQGTGV